MTVQAHTIGCDLLGDIINPMLGFCYNRGVTTISGKNSLIFPDIFSEIILIFP